MVGRADILGLFLQFEDLLYLYSSAQLYDASVLIEDLALFVLQEQFRPCTLFQMDLLERLEDSIFVYAIDDLRHGITTSGLLHLQVLL